MQWLGEKEIPFVIIFTKSDKLTKNVLNQNIDDYKEEMLKDWEEIPPFFCSSTLKKEGKKEILHFIEQTNSIFIS